MEKASRSFEPAARSGEAITGKVGSHDGGLSSKAWTDSLGQRSVEHALRGPGGKVLSKSQRAQQRRRVKTQECPGGDGGGDHAEEWRRVPTDTQTVVASETQPCVEFCAQCDGPDKFGSPDVAAFFGHSEHSRENHARCVHARFVVNVVEIQCMRRRTVNKGRRGRRKFLFGRKSRRVAAALPL
ncbi:MAG: hypothetical protein WDN48_07425 [Pseudolabrys sp.]